MSLQRIFYKGERVDFVLNANQTSGYYWIHVRALGECEENLVYQLANIVYNGSLETSLSPKPGYFDGISNNLVSNFLSNLYSLFFFSFIFCLFIN